MKKIKRNFKEFQLKNINNEIIKNHLSSIKNNKKIIIRIDEDNNCIQYYNDNDYFILEYPIYFYELTKKELNSIIDFINKEC